MGKHGLKTFDCDMHVIEPADLWQRYTDPEFRDKAPHGLTDVPRDIALLIDGERFPRNTKLTLRSLQVTQGAAAAEPYVESEARGYDAVSQLMAMDREGIDRTVLFPSRGLFALAFDSMDPALANAICRGYNDWMAEFCSADPYRLLAAAMIPPHDVNAAIAEAKRTVVRYGFKAAFMRPNPINGRYWHHPDFDPLWAALSDLDMPIGFHEAGSGELPTIEQTGARFDRSVMAHVVTHPLEMMQACISICMGGVLERFPQLRVAFLEGNCGWVPWLLWRMDEHLGWRGGVELPDLRRRPSEYFRENCWVSLDCDEQPGVHAAEYLDGDQIVFSTDYPHGDCKYPNALDTFLRLPLQSEHVQKILWDNAVRLYHLDSELLK